MIFEIEDGINVEYSLKLYLQKILDHTVVGDFIFWVIDGLETLFKERNTLERFGAHFKSITNFLKDPPFRRIRLVLINSTDEYVEGNYLASPLNAFAPVKPSKITKAQIKELIQLIQLYGLTTT